MNENTKWQKDLNKVRKRVIKNQPDSIAQNNVKLALGEVQETCVCIQEKLGSCTGCRIAQLAVSLMRWTEIEERETNKLVSPLCQSLAGAEGRTTMNTKGMRVEKH